MARNLSFGQKTAPFSRIAAELGVGTQVRNATCPAVCAIQIVLSIPTLSQRASYAVGTVDFDEFRGKLLHCRHSVVLGMRMLSEPIVASTSFDEVAERYDQELNRGISLSGESSEYFVDGRVQWLKSVVERLDLTAPRLLDFGCGVGNAGHKLLQELRGQSLVGFDLSTASVRQARLRWPASNLSWTSEPADLELEAFDIVYTSGVFHHIPVEARQHELQRIYQSLRPGGVFALFENNPWNPGTRWVMSRIPFDQDAVTLTPYETRRRMAEAGFQIEQTRYLFFFPRSLRIFRRLENRLARIPLGAQYVVLGRKLP
jgi:SAM-dependent methyltransferase